MNFLNRLLVDELMHLIFNIYDYKYNITCISQTLFMHFVYNVNVLYNANVCQLDLRHSLVCHSYAVTISIQLWELFIKYSNLVFWIIMGNNILNNDMLIMHTHLLIANPTHYD